MKTKILTIDGKARKEIELPKAFSVGIREDLIAKVLEAKKSQQPYSPSPVAGNQASASGKLVHRRHVWKSQYGRGMSRVPRKSMSRRGSQFNWVGATVPNTRKGRRAHGPKIAQFINTSKINKKELRLALASALAATADEKMLKKKYSSIEKVGNLPFVVEDKFSGLKAKDLIKGLTEMLGKELSNVGLKKKTVRAGKGTLRGRKYKSSAGLLFVAGKDEKLKTKRFDVVRASSVGVNDLAKGGPGRLTVYTENAIKEIGERLKKTK